MTQDTISRPSIRYLHDAYVAVMPGGKVEHLHDAEDPPLLLIGVQDLLAGNLEHLLHDNPYAAHFKANMVQHFAKKQFRDKWEELHFSSGYEDELDLRYGQYRPSVHHKLNRLDGETDEHQDLDPHECTKICFSAAQRHLDDIADEIYQEAWDLLKGQLSVGEQKALAEKAPLRPDQKTAIQTLCEDACEHEDLFRNALADDVNRVQKIVQSLPQEMQQFLHKRGALINVRGHFDDEYQATALHNANAVVMWIKSENEQRSDYDNISTIQEEVVHLIDHWLGYSDRRAWRSAVKKDVPYLKYVPGIDEETDAIQCLNELRNYINKDVIHYPSTTYDKSDLPAELLAELFIMDYIEQESGWHIHPDDKPLSECFPHCWPRYLTFKEEIKEQIQAEYDELPEQQVDASEAEIAPVQSSQKVVGG